MILAFYPICFISNCTVRLFLDVMGTVHTLTHFFLPLSPYLIENSLSEWKEKSANFQKARANVSLWSRISFYCTWLINQQK